MSNFTTLDLTNHATICLTGSTVKNKSAYSLLEREFPCSILRYFSPTLMLIFNCCLQLLLFQKDILLLVFFPLTTTFSSKDCQSTKLPIFYLISPLVEKTSRLKSFSPLFFKQTLHYSLTYRMWIWTNGLTGQIFTGKYLVYTCEQALPKRLYTLAESGRSSQMLLGSVKSQNTFFQLTVSLQQSKELTRQSAKAGSIPPMQYLSVGNLCTSARTSSSWAMLIRFPSANRAVSLATIFWTFGSSSTDITSMRPQLAWVTRRGRFPVFQYPQEQACMNSSRVQMGEQTVSTRLGSGLPSGLEKSNAVLNNFWKSTITCFMLLLRILSAFLAPICSSSQTTELSPIFLRYFSTSVVFSRQSWIGWLFRVCIFLSRASLS